jgi:hypothetical protein
MEFDSWQSHERHVDKEHGGNFLFRCGLCPQTFDTVQRMRMHR